MNNFLDYANYYDILYHDKDYEAEVDYIENTIFGESAQGPKSILELGCGTGVHTKLLADRGHSLHAIDLSSNMLEVAKKRIEDVDQADRLKFNVGDARDYRAGKKFDVVLSLFHVASYQATNGDFEKFILTAKEHLNPGGILLFDFWHKPAVLFEKPELRVKRCESKIGHLVRIAEPKLHIERDIVDVNYQIFISDEKKSDYQTFREKHVMRYFSCDFVLKVLGKHGFGSIHFEEWLSKERPTRKTWGVCALARLE